MVPFGRISKNVGSKRSKSHYFRKNTTRIKTKIYHSACHFNSVWWFMLALKNERKHQWQSHFRDCGGWTLSLFLSHLWPAKCSGQGYFLKKVHLDLDFNDRNVDQSFGKRINAFWTNLHCLFSQHECFYLGS